uniref:Ig-like domain-containing protein n=1 Tax=Salarias fasciatus TaxID=181472 RepID=A0A672HGC8_SALFA
LAAHSHCLLVGEVTADEGHSVTLDCLYNTTSSNYYLFWYKQEGNKSPKFILSRFKFGGGKTEDEEKYSSTLDSSLRSVPLKIQKLELSDSAVYYCALQPTVTGNSSTVDENLWSKDNTILLYIHLRDSHTLHHIQPQQCFHITENQIDHMSISQNLRGGRRGSKVICVETWTQQRSQNKTRNDSTSHSESLTELNFAASRMFQKAFLWLHPPSLNSTNEMVCVFTAGNRSSLMLRRKTAAENLLSSSHCRVMQLHLLLGVCLHLIGECCSLPGRTAHVVI